LLEDVVVCPKVIRAKAGIHGGYMKKFFRITKIHVFLLSLLTIGAVALAQFPTIKLPKISTGNPFEKDSPITTSLADAVTEIPFLDDFEPSDISPLSLLPRGPNNGFLIQNPGAYWFSAQSYCFHAGTHSPSKGKGYLYAPLKGPKSEMIRLLLQRSVSYPNIPQSKVQTLVWAILAQTKPSKMNSEINATAKLLLTKEEISTLEGSAFDEMSQDLFGRALGKLPPQTQRIFEAERQLRNAMSGNVPYGELERIAVLTGEPLPGKDDRNVPSGRWSYNPEGYFARFFPNGYPTTQMDIYIPENIRVERDAQNRIIAINAAKSNRLVVEYDDAVPPLTVNKENSLKGFPFKQIRLEFTLPRYEKIKYKQALGTVTMAEWNNRGWTFAGIFEGKGKVSGSESRYDNAGGRYDLAKRQNEELKKLLKNIEKLDKNKKVREFTATETENLLSLMQFSAALRELFAAQGIERYSLFFDPVELTQRAWAFEFEMLVKSHQNLTLYQPSFLPKNIFANISLFDAPPMTNFYFGEVSPNKFTATPADTGRQRLGISPRSTDKDEKCKDEFNDCNTDSGSSYMECFASCGANMPSKPTLGQLNEARKCFSACESSYSQQNRECSRAAKRCAKN